MRTAAERKGDALVGVQMVTFQHFHRLIIADEMNPSCQGARARPLPTPHPQRSPTLSHTPFWGERRLQVIATSEPKAHENV